MIPWVNIHAHGALEAEAGAIIVLNRTQREFHQLAPSPVLYSAGLHPWYIDAKRVDADWQLLQRLVEGQKLVALGECGLDILRGPRLDIQADWLRQQLLLAARHALPVVIHCVRAHGELVALIKKMRLSVHIIIHGFNQKATILAAFLQNDFYVSVGAAILRGDSNAAKCLSQIPPEKLFLETDDKAVSIQLIYEAAARILDMPVEDLKTTIFQNYTRVFSKNRVEI